MKWIIKLTKKEEYEILNVSPWYYGIAYYEYNNMTTVLAIIPLNIIIGFGRWIIYRLTIGFYPNIINQAYYKGEAAGRLSEIVISYHDVIYDRLSEIIDKKMDESLVRIINRFNENFDNKLKEKFEKERTAAKGDNT